MERALGAAEESIRLNPRATRLPHVPAALRTGLGQLEHIWVSTRGLSRSIADGTHDAADPAYGRAAQEHLAAVRAYGRLVRSDVAGDPGRAEGELTRSLAAAQHHRDRVAGILLSLPPDDLGEWSLRGELLVHLDRLLDQLRVEHRARQRETWPGRRPRRQRPRGGTRTSPAAVHLARR